MTREEAIKHLEAQAQCNYIPTREAAQMAIASLRAQQEAEKNEPLTGWISVNDRMPESEDFVLVIASGNPKSNITLQNAYELAEYSKEEGWIFEGWLEWEDANVTHWMPLPEPPKEVGHA